MGHLANMPPRKRKARSPPPPKTRTHEPAAAASSSEDEDERSLNANSASDIRVGDRIAFCWTKEMNMICSNAEVTEVKEVSLGWACWNSLDSHRAPSHRR